MGTGVEKITEENLLIIKNKMLYSLLWVERKKTKAGADLLQVRAKDLTGEEVDFTIWKTDKDGKVFPNFDTLAGGMNVEGNAWTSPKDGKITLYPPKQEARKMYPPKSANMEKVMERKEASIEKSQDRKEDSIKISGAQRDATLMVTTFYTNNLLSDVELKLKWQEWKTYFLSQYDSAF